MSSVEHLTTDGGDSTLLSKTTDWGLSVPEAKSQMTLAKRCLLLTGYAVFVVASVWIIPVLIGH